MTGFAKTVGKSGKGCKVYIAGPMRGHEDLNFPAFFKAESLAQELGWVPVNPARMDQESSIQEKATGNATPRELRAFAARDIGVLLTFEAEKGDAIAMLPGWEKSLGARTEYHAAKWLGLKILSAETFEPLKERALGNIRTFPSGSIRDSNVGKHEYARFLDPRVIKVYGEYMDRHRHLKDGSIRDPDNWKHGQGLQTWVDSLWRHVMDLWEIHEYGEAVRPENGERISVKEALCGILFNAMGYLREVLLNTPAPTETGPASVTTYSPTELPKTVSPNSSLAVAALKSQRPGGSRCE